MKNTSESCHKDFKIERRIAHDRKAFRTFYEEKQSSQEPLIKDTVFISARSKQKKLDSIQSFIISINGRS